MEYENLEGKKGGRLIYVPSEKMIYAFKISRSGQDIFECYQKILTDRKKKDCMDHLKCTSRVRLLPNGLCERVNVHIPHTKHNVHELIAADKKRMQNMKATCRTLQENVPESAHRIANRDVFQREIAK